jgi:heat induced stress protein YflT
MTTMSSSTSSPSSSSASSSSGVDATGAALERIGSDAPARDSRPVGADDRAVVAVVSDMDAAQDAAERLIAAGIGTDHVSIVGKDAQSPRRVNGFVTTGSIAGQSAAAGAWIGGVFGLLMGTALLFVPGAGPLIVLGPLAAAAVGAAQGGLLGGAVAVLLGHFVEDDERQRYEQLVRDGCCLVVVHGDEQEVARARQLLDEAGTIETRRQDTYRGPGPRIGPIHLVREGMQVADAAGSKIGKVVLVKMGDPEAVTVEHDPDAEPHLPDELAERLLRTGFIKIDRKGLLKPDVYTAADEIDTVDRDLVRLSVPVDGLATEATST